MECVRFGLSAVSGTCWGFWNMLPADEGDCSVSFMLPHLVLTAGEQTQVCGLRCDHPHECC